MNYLRRLRRRYRCHRTSWCCQYVDKPMCNSPHESHFFARLRYQLRVRREIKEDARWP